LLVDAWSSRELSVIAVAADCGIVAADDRGWGLRASTNPVLGITPGAGLFFIQGRIERWIFF